ncbi:MAG: hypothetical protein OXG72_21265 [Acidobacteria bacterium]|nr:hypothetical protein [Acidobacteriota bacterium]
MDATAWTVVGATIAILVAIGTSFRSLRDEMRAEMRGLRERIDAQSEQMGLLRERMAHLEGLLEGLREAITGKRVA